MDDIKKALNVGSRGDGSLKVESLDVLLKQVTFNTNNLTLWPNIYEGYDLVDLHGHLKVGTINYSDTLCIFEMFDALARVRIIRDTLVSGGERMHVDARPYVFES